MVEIVACKECLDTDIKLLNYCAYDELICKNCGNYVRRYHDTANEDVTHDLLNSMWNKANEA